MHRTKQTCTITDVVWIGMCQIYCFIFFYFFGFWIHTASTPITSGAHTDGGKWSNTRAYVPISYDARSKLTADSWYFVRTRRDSGSMRSLAYRLYPRSISANFLKNLHHSRPLSLIFDLSCMGPKSSPILSDEHHSQDLVHGIGEKLSLTYCYSPAGRTLWETGIMRWLARLLAVACATWHLPLRSVTKRADWYPLCPGYGKICGGKRRNYAGVSDLEPELNNVEK